MIWYNPLHGAKLIFEFVCVHTLRYVQRSLGAETHRVLMGPDSNKMLKPKTYYAGLAVYGNKSEADWSERYWKEEKDIGHSQQIKSNNFTTSLWFKRREKLIQSQLPLRLTKLSVSCESLNNYYLSVAAELGSSKILRWTGTKHLPPRKLVGLAHSFSVCG